MVNTNRLLDTFFSLISIDSPSSEEKPIASYIYKELQKLGGNPIYDSYGNLYAFFAGKGTPVLLNSHMDTVEPGKGIKTVQKGNRIYSNKKTILGADAKAGIAIILELLAIQKEHNTLLPSLEIVLTREEEIGVVGARHIDYSKLHAKYGLVFDGDYGPNTVTIASPGYYLFDCAINGKEAHAGMEPELGISSISIAGDIISKFPIGRIDNETTQNIGLISGGSARNTIAGQTILKGEIRSRNKQTFKKCIATLGNTLKHIKKKYPKANILLTKDKIFNPYEYQLSHPFIKNLCKAINEVGFKPKCIPSGGGTDANVLSAKGITAVPIGFGAYNTHTTNEYLVISEMVKTTEICLKLLSTSK